MYVLYNRYFQHGHIRRESFQANSLFCSFAYDSIFLRKVSSGEYVPVEVTSQNKQ